MGNLCCALGWVVSFTTWPLYHPTSPRQEYTLNVMLIGPTGLLRILWSTKISLVSDVNELQLHCRLEFITNLMHNFIYSIIILHHDPQYVSTIAVLIFSPLLIGALHGSIQSVTIPDTVNIQIVLLKISTAMLETC
jgi:hypothetical protein